MRSEDCILGVQSAIVAVGVSCPSQVATPAAIHQPIACANTIFHTDSGRIELYSACTTHTRCLPRSNQPHLQVFIRRGVLRTTIPFDVKSDELRTCLVAVFLKPVGIHQAWSIFVWVGNDRRHQFGILGSRCVRGHPIPLLIQGSILQSMVLSGGRLSPKVAVSFYETDHRYTQVWRDGRSSSDRNFRRKSPTRKNVHLSIDVLNATLPATSCISDICHSPQQLQHRLALHEVMRTAAQISHRVC